MMYINLGVFGGTPGQVVLQPTTQDSNNYDTIVYSGAPTTNYKDYGWNQINLYSEISSLVRFDLSSIPVGATITGVTFRFYYTFYYNSPTGTFKFHRILSGNSDWDYTTATWNNRKTGTSWAGSNGCGTAGTDYASAEMGTLTCPTTTSQYYDVTFDTTEFTNMWNANYGFICRSPDMSPVSGATGFATFNDATSSYHPKLTIDYTT